MHRDADARYTNTGAVLVVVVRGKVGLEKTAKIDDGRETEQNRVYVYPARRLESEYKRRRT